ncbi:glycosyltransferase [Bacillus daqingensis]|uniref:Glycosyltransferase n=1 Tax=Bacillus daqingensis TaxID=872396 RepID=A0ABV9NPX3_9BACI
MTKELLIISFDLEIGGVEKSLLSLLDHLKESPYNISLFLMSHSGDLANKVPEHVTLLQEIPEYKTFRQSIKSVLKSKHYRLASARISAKWKAGIVGKVKKLEEPGYQQMQLMWKKSIRYLPDIPGSYDMVISYLWPHFAASKVKAGKSAAWIHTDFSSVEVNKKIDLAMWKQFNSIIAISDSVAKAFITNYPELEDRTETIENVLSPERIKDLGGERSEEKSQVTKIVTISRLSHAKGIDTAVKTAAELKKRGTITFEWTVIGYGGEESALKSLITEFNVGDCFKLVGKKINPYPDLAKADIYVQPSRYEGKAVTVLEAQIMELPVIITNYPTASTQVKDGVDGIISGTTCIELANDIEKMAGDTELQEKLRIGCQNIDFSATKQMTQFHNLIGEEA